MEFFLSLKLNEMFEIRWSLWKDEEEAKSDSSWLKLEKAEIKPSGSIEFVERQTALARRSTEVCRFQREPKPGHINWFGGLPRVEIY